MQGPNELIDFDRVITALMDNENPFPVAYLRYFSDLEHTDLRQMKGVWTQVNPERRLELLRMLVAVSAEDTLVCFDNFAKFGLTDSDPRVRTESIRLLEECPDPKVAVSLIDIMQHDIDPPTRATAAELLGWFEYLGELQEIPETIYEQVEESLLDVLRGSDLPVVRRKALESLGYSSNEIIMPIIENALETGEEEWMVSALVAIGRSLDNRWAPDVLLNMKSQLTDVRRAAVFAAGALEMQSARQPLLEMLEDPDQLPELLRRAAIWSLSQIGGEEVGAALEFMLENTEDDEEIGFLEDALDNLEFTEGLPNFDLLDYDPAVLATNLIEEAEPWPEPHISRGTSSEEDEDDENETDEGYEENEEDSEDDL